MSSPTDLTPSAAVSSLTPSPIVHAPGSPIGEVVRGCERIAPSDATVLITGETGTGKEVFARYVHEHSARSKRPFVPVNCGAIPEALLESELFGHVRGAFTGATTTRRGRVALAEGGTLFLDEIGELPLSLQVKLLRLLQERTYEPVGASESVPANFRLIAATHRNLADEVAAGRFRRDLYYRLLVCPMHLPALRERKNDVKPLIMHFWNGRGETRTMEAATLTHLEGYAWPGNVRELENLVERLSVCVEGASIRPADLPIEFRKPLSLVDTDSVTPMLQPVVAAQVTANAEAATASAKLTLAPAVPSGHEPQLPIDLPKMLRELEDRYIELALRQAEGNKKLAADMLGLQRTTLVEKLRRRNKETTAELVPVIAPQTLAVG